VVLRPVEPDDVAELVRIRRTSEVHHRWGDVDSDLAAGWPFDDPETICFVVLLEGRVVGLIQYKEENEPRYRHAGIDIFLDPTCTDAATGAMRFGPLRATWSAIAATIG